MRAALVVAVMVATVAGAGGVAGAYPQFELSKGNNCASCHVSPTGGGLLNEMGLSTAEDLGARSSDSAFLYGAWAPPDWLKLGGDARLAAGAVGRGDYGPAAAPAGFPMQADLYVQAGTRTISANAVVGFGAAGEATASFIQSREHYLQYRKHELYVRAGRFMPTYGLRLAEHVAYARRYTSTYLYSEGYGAQVGWVGAGFQVHVSAFVHDFLRPPVETGDGGAIYAEKRLGRRGAVGVSGRYAGADDEARTQGGLTGKLWLSGPQLLFQVQGDFIHQTIVDEPSRNQLVAYLLATLFHGRSWMYDVGVGHFDEDLDVAKTERDVVDLNVHWFASPHWEVLAMGRVEALGLGDGGPTSWWTLLQVHYRL